MPCNQKTTLNHERKWQSLQHITSHVGISKNKVDGKAPAPLLQRWPCFCPSCWNKNFIPGIVMHVQEDLPSLWIGISSQIKIWGFKRQSCVKSSYRASTSRHLHARNYLCNVTSERSWTIRSIWLTVSHCTLLLYMIWPLYVMLMTNGLEVISLKCIDHSLVTCDDRTVCIRNIKSHSHSNVAIEPAKQL